MYSFQGLFHRCGNGYLPLNIPIKAARRLIPDIRPVPPFHVEKRDRSLNQKNIKKLPAPEHGDPGQKTKLPPFFDRNK